MPKKTIEVWIVIDAEGDYEVGGSESEATERYDENFTYSGPRRLVKLAVKITPPASDVAEAEVDVADEAGQAIEAQAE